MRREGKNKIIFNDIFPTILIMVGFIVVLTMLTDKFMTVTNLLNIVRQVSMMFITAAGMTLLLVSGGVDISVGSMVAVTGVFSSAAMVNWGVNPVFAILFGVLIGAVLGFINGFIIVKSNIAPIIVTLATMSVYRSFPYLYTNAEPVFGLSKEFKYVGQGYIGPIPFPVVLIILVFVIFSITLSETKFGLRLYAIGSNEKATRLTGIDTNKYKLAAYIITGAMAGFSGVMLAARLGSGVASSGTGFEFDVLTAVLIGGVSLSGGKGRMSGALIGCLIMGILSNGLNLLNVSTYYQMLLKGLMLLMAVWIDTYAKNASNKV